jgi:hypothetical protein
MDAILLDSIPYKVNFNALRKRLHVREGSQDERELMSLAAGAAQLARPRAYYRLASIYEREDSAVTISKVQFHSRVLSVNLAKAETGYAFVATCGVELQSWGEGFDDVLLGYWTEAIKEEALRCALEAIYEHIRSTFAPGHISTMSPGSLEDWPIQQQEPLFRLLGDPESKIGVRLTESLLMVPTKSVSGIIFPTDASFESCLLCSREGCQGRRAPYDETLFEKEYCPAV